MLCGHASCAAGWRCVLLVEWGCFSRPYRTPAVRHRSRTMGVRIVLVVRESGRVSLDIGKGGGGTRRHRPSYSTGRTGGRCKMAVPQTLSTRRRSSRTETKNAHIPANLSIPSMDGTLLEIAVLQTLSFLLPIPPPPHTLPLCLSGHSARHWTHILRLDACRTMVLTSP